MWNFDREPNAISMSEVNEWVPLLEINGVCGFATCQPTYAVPLNSCESGRGQ
jgi:hypothetical protein